MTQYNTWTESWEGLFSNYVKQLMLAIEEAQGPGAERRQILDTTVEKAIPQLLRPLETGGGQI